MLPRKATLVATVHNTGTGKFIDSTGNRLSISDSVFTGPESAIAFTCVSVRQNEEVELLGTILSPGTANVTRGIYAQSTTLLVRDSEISAGAGASNAIAVESDRSRVTLKNTKLSTTEEARYSVAVFAETTRLSLIGCQIDLNARFGSTGIKSSGGSFEVISNRIFGHHSSE